MFGRGTRASKAILTDGGYDHVPEEVPHGSKYKGRFEQVGQHHLPYCSRLASLPGYTGWHWEVSHSNGLSSSGYAFTREGAVREVERALQDAYYSFCSELAVIEGKAFKG